jgi:hypothetical protein
VTLASFSLFPRKAFLGRFGLSIAIASGLVEASDLFLRVGGHPRVQPEIQALLTVLQFVNRNVFLGALRERIRPAIGKLNCHGVRYLPISYETLD